MSGYMDVYRSKLISADDAAGMVKSGDVVDFYAFFACSQYLDGALAKRAGELEGVTIRSNLRFSPPMKSFAADATGRAFRLDSMFRGRNENLVAPHGGGSVPARLGRYESIYQTGQLSSDFAAIMVSPPDDDGYFHFCPSPAFSGAVARTTKCFLAEVNESYFHLEGTEDRRIHVSEVGYVIEGDNPPLADLPSVEPTATEVRIAEVLLPEIPDGACLQIGYGSVPMAAAKVINASSLKNLGVHTEVLPEGLMALYESGKINGSRKGIDRGKMVAAILVGGRSLWEFARGCRDIHMAACSYTNDPFVMSRNDNLITVNGFIEVDLIGQVNAESVGHRPVSGTGGQLDFVLGSDLSRGGKAILCAPSTYTGKDGKVGSRIVATLAAGATVTTPRSCVQYVATEYGIVNLRGKNVRERAEALISVAHPEFRQDLENGAKALKIF